MVKVEIHNRNTTPVTVKSFVFSGGEVQVNISDFNRRIMDDTVEITANLTSSDDIMTLLLTVDALRRMYKYPVPINLICPYIPYARQDRVMNKGEALSISVMAKLINSMNFSLVEVWDAHSDVSLALINNIINYPPENFLTRLPIPIKDCVLVSPDAGANKKVLKVASTFKVPMVRADKTRSVVDGSITGTVVYSEHIGDKNFLIVDDICDGGRTFTELAKVLRPLTNGKIYLYVTHGIFSKGFNPFRGLIDHVYSANTFPNVLSDPIHTTLNLGYDPTHN